MAVLNSVMPAGHWALQIESILGFSAEKGYGNEPSKGREGNASATVQVTCTRKGSFKARNAKIVPIMSRDYHVMRLVQHQRQEMFLNMLSRGVPSCQTAGRAQHHVHLPSQTLHLTCKPQSLAGAWILSFYI